MAGDAPTRGPQPKAKGNAVSEVWRRKERDEQVVREVLHAEVESNAENCLSNALALRASENPEVAGHLSDVAEFYFVMLREITVNQLVPRKDAPVSCCANLETGSAFFHHALHVGIGDRC